MATPGIMQTGYGADPIGSAWGKMSNASSFGDLASGALGMLGIGPTVQNQFDPYAQQLQLGQGQGAMSSPVAAMMQARAMGQGGPSAADTLLTRGTDQAQAAAAAAAAGSNNPAQARRIQIMGAGNIAQQGAQAAAIQKAQEEQAAQQQYMGGAMTQQGQAVGQNTALTQTAADIAKQNQEAAQKAQGGLMSGAAGAIASIFSDRNLKHDIDEKKGSEGMAQFLKTLHAARYEYDDEDHGKGPQYGIMAQDALKSEVGRTFVRETPEGLQLDGARAIGPILAALAHLDSKIDGGSK
jgi:hypothetical protein